jgi:ABC-type Zn2+ transport system substrate-binding protein/surface adhesin
MYEWQEDTLNAAPAAAASSASGHRAAEASLTCDGGQAAAAPDADAGEREHEHGQGERADGAAGGNAGGSCSAHSHSHDGHADHDHDHDHHDHHHHHDPTARLTSGGLLRFLRQHSTFAAEVPEVSLGERWAGRDMFRAVAEGLEVIRQQHGELRAQVAALQAANARLRDENLALRAACK